MAPALITPRARVAQFVREQIDGKDNVNLPDLVETALGHFLRDPAWVEAFLREQFTATLYTIAQNVIAQRRSGQIIIGNTIASATGAKAIAARRPRWQLWLEHDGSEYVALPAMTREGLLRAAESREQRADREQTIATVWRALADGLQPGQRVGDIYDDDQINAIVDSIGTGIPATFQPTLPSLPIP